MVFKNFLGRQGISPQNTLPQFLAIWSSEIKKLYIYDWNCCLNFFHLKEERNKLDYISCMYHTIGFQLGPLKYSIFSGE